MTAGVVVVGAGVMGSAAARALSRRGREVLLLERFRVGHTRGSSHGVSRIFRLSYPEARYVRMAMRALPLWRELERETGRTLLRTLGGLDTGEPVARHAAALAESGAAHDLLDGAEAARRFPSVSLPAGMPVLFQPDAGIVEADAAVRALADSAVAHGAELREGGRVLELRGGGERAGVVTEAETLSARAVVVTAGAWARGLLAGAGVEIPTTPSRETVAYFRLPEGVVPPSFVEWGGTPRYAAYAPGRGLKAGEHRAGPAADPEEEGAPSEESLARVADWVAARFPGAVSEPPEAETCLYTNTPDEGFIVERSGPLVIGSACSGHGFKFAPLIGERLADLAEEALGAA